MQTWNENAACRGAWRRIFARSPIVREVLAEGRREVPRYKKDGSRHKVDAVEHHCQVCNTWVPRKIISVDHIIPVIDDEIGFQDWNVFHKRLFCDKKNLQRICDPCHDKKTAKERLKRNTIKYNLELDAIENTIRKTSVESQSTQKLLKKLLSKYKTKTRPPVIRERAIHLLDLLFNPPKAKRRRR